MGFLKKYRLLSIILVVAILAAGGVLIYQIRYNQRANCVAGLLSDSQGGSDFVVYDTNTWIPTILLKLPDVSPDNYGAISADGKYIAYTKWDTDNARRFLEVYSLLSGKSEAFLQDLPAKNEIIKISWLPDNKTLLFIRNDANMPFYQEIQTLNVETGEQNTLAKGEVWQVRSIEDNGTTAEDFYLKGHDTYLKVKEKKPSETYNPAHPIDYSEEWNYYLDQNDIDEIYHYYGGTGAFDINDVPGLMYVEFSPPRCSSDGTKIIYSATLQRNSAPGMASPLWMTSAIWEYNFKTGKSSIIYRQTDGAAIGRVEWIDDNELSFITYYDFQGSRDSINTLTLSSNEHQVIFPFSDENYNNVTLLPIGNRQITFTTSKKDDPYEKSSTILFDINSNKYSDLDIKLGNKNVLLQQFGFTRLSGKILKNYGLK